MQRLSWIIGAVLWVIAASARADCQADQGSVTSISADGVTVTCDTQDPNPFTSGIGSQATNTNLTVDIGADSEVSTSGSAVRLGSGGTLTNEGTVTSTTGDAVVVIDTLGQTAPTIDNQGSLVSTTGAGISIASGFEDATITNSGTIRAATVGIETGAGEIDNSGTITVTGDAATAVSAGSATLTNTGTITGTAVGVSGSGTINNNSDGVIEAQDTALSLSSGTLNNSGQIRLTNTGGTAVSAENSTLSNSGTVTSDATAFSMNGGSLSNSGTINGDVNLMSGATLSNSGTINSSVTADGNVSITNSGTISTSGDSIMLSGGGNTLTLQTGSSISGAIRSVFEGTPTDSLVLEGQGTLNSTVENFGSLTVRGNTWNLSGAVSVMAVNIESGRLNINGTLDTGVGTANPGLVSLQQGTLGGTGTLIADVNNASGTVSPGNATGTFTIDGDYTQGAAGTLRIASDAGGRGGLLRVTGTASLAGTVVVQAGSDGIYDFLTADGGIEGGFDDVQVDGRALVTLVPGDNTLSFVRASTTVEDNVVHAALDAATLTLDAFQTGGRANGPNGVWVKPLVHYGEKDESEGIVGSDFTILGGMAGVDWSFGGLRVGVGAGYTQTDLDIDDGGEGEAGNTMYGAYFEYTVGSYYAGLTVSGASSEYEHDRSIFINDQRSRASADYDGDTLALRLAVGGIFPFYGSWGEHWVAEPELRADYILVDLDPYIEDGGTGLRVETEDDIEAAEFAALYHMRRTSTEGLGMAPRLHVGVVHRIAIDDREWSATDPGSGIALLLPGDDEDITGFRFGAGLDFELGRHWVGSVDYLGEVGDDADGHSLVAGIKLRL